MPDYTRITQGFVANLRIRNGEYEQTRRTLWAQVAVTAKSRRRPHGKLNQQRIVGSFASRTAQLRRLHPKQQAPRLRCMAKGYCSAPLVLPYQGSQVHQIAKAPQNRSSPILWYFYNYFPSTVGLLDNDGFPRTMLLGNDKRRRIQGRQG